MRASPRQDLLAAVDLSIRAALAWRKDERSLPDKFVRQLEQFGYTVVKLPKPDPPCPT